MPMTVPRNPSDGATAMQSVIQEQPFSSRAACTLPGDVESCSGYVNALLPLLPEGSVEIVPREKVTAQHAAQTLDRRKLAKELAEGFRKEQRAFLTFMKGDRTGKLDETVSLNNLRRLKERYGELVAAQRNKSNEK